MSTYGGFGGGRSRRLKPRLSVIGSPPSEDRPGSIFTQTPRPQTSFRPVSQRGMGTGIPTPPGVTQRPPSAFGGNQPLPQQAFELAEQNYQRPRSALDMILRALMLPENIVVGFHRGMMDGAVSANALAPWTYVKALGMGFKEIPTAVSEGATWTDFIRENEDPESFYYKHASTIGLGMSVFFDPTMYLTFGGTGAAKLAARGLWYENVRESADEAVKFMASGRQHPITGRAYSPKDDINMVIGEMHLAHGRPFTLGDSMDALRKADRAGAAGLYHRVFARGGSGTRFAGMEVPGTREVGQSVAKLFRGASGDLLSNRGASDFLARAFVPDAAMHSIGSDLVRTAALLENNAIRRQTAAQGEKVSKMAEKIALLDNPIARTVGGILGGPQRYVPQAVRAGVLRDPKGITDPTVRTLINKAHLSKAKVIGKAQRSGMDEGQVRGINELWDRLVKDIDDPVQVVAQFVARTEGRILAHSQISRILDNPILARRIVEDLPGPAEGLAVKKLEDFGEMSMLGQVIKQNTKPFRWKGKDYAVNEVVAEALENLKNPAFIDVEMSRFFRFINGPQNLWKIPATILNPSFHLTNVVGGMWNNMLAGPYGPIDHLESWARVAQRRIDEEISKGWVSKPVLAATRATVLRGAAGKPSLIRGRERPDRLAQDIITPFEERGGGGRGMVATEIAKETRVGDRPWLPRVGRSGGFVPRVTETGRAFTLARRTTAGLGAAEIATNIAAYNDWIEDFNIPGGNEFWGVVGFTPELARAGRFTGSYTEDILRLTPFQETWKDKSIRQLMEAVGPITPPQFAKMAPKGLTKRQESAMFDIGTEVTIRYQFDYTHLTDIERKFAKTIFPFWTFYKNNFVLQSKEILQRPRFVEGFYHMANYVEEEWGEDLSPEMERLLPEYFNHLGAFQVPVPDWARDKFGLPQDTPLFLNPKLPFVSLNLFPPFWELFNDKSVTPFWQRAQQVVSPVTGSVGPFALLGSKLMFESMTGTNLGLARPIDYQRASSSDWRQSFTPAPGYLKYLPEQLSALFGGITDPETGQIIMPATHKYILDNMSSPFISNYGKVVPTSATGARGDKARADLVAWMTGIRLMPVDPLKISRSWSYRLESMLEARQAELAERQLELEPEDEITLRRVRVLIKGIENQWDVREAELYGTGTA